MFLSSLCQFVWIYTDGTCAGSNFIWVPATAGALIYISANWTDVFGLQYE